MATTPPPPERVRTPPTPLHGPKYDTWEPYSPRRSARSLGKRAQNLTSPPRQQTRATATVTSTPRKRGLTRQISSQTLSPPSSPENSLRHLTIPQASSASHSNTTDDTAVESGDGSHMFPTPKKTPKKQDSRILHFQALSHDLLPSPRKRRQRITLDSPSGSPPEAAVTIFTDSQYRVPDMDQAEENPFVGPRHGNRTTTTRPHSKPKNKEEEEMEQAVQNGEGLIYTL